MVQKSTRKTSPSPQPKKGKKGRGRKGKSAPKRTSSPEEPVEVEILDESPQLPLGVSVLTRSQRAAQAARDAAPTPSRNAQSTRRPVVETVSDSEDDDSVPELADQDNSTVTSGASTSGSLPTVPGRADRDNSTVTSGTSAPGSLPTLVRHDNSTTTSGPSDDDSTIATDPGVGWHDVEEAPPPDPLRPYRRDTVRPSRHEMDSSAPPPARKVGKLRIPETGAQRYNRLKGLNGETCYVLITDRKSGAMQVSVRRDKSPPIDFLRQWLSRYGSSSRDRTVRFDEGGELGRCTEIHQMFRDAGYTVEVTAPDSSSEIGGVERPHRSIGDAVRTMLLSRTTAHLTLP